MKDLRNKIKLYLIYIDILDYSNSIEYIRDYVVNYDNYDKLINLNNELNKVLKQYIDDINKDIVLNINILDRVIRLNKRIDYFVKSREK